MTHCQSDASSLLSSSISHSSQSPPDQRVRHHHQNGITEHQDALTPEKHPISDEGVHHLGSVFAVVFGYGNVPTDEHVGEGSEGCDCDDRAEKDAHFSGTEDI